MGGRVFRFQQHYEDKLAASPYHSLWGYADRREDALRDLHESFDYIYREIAEEADESLDDVAKKLKQKLRELVVTQDGGSVAHA